MTKQNFILKLRNSAWQIKKIIFFDSSFNLLILFLISFILLLGIGFNYGAVTIIAAIALSMIISIILFLKKIKRYDVVGKISLKYPDFEESLETAYDNKDKDEKDNIIIRSLMRDASNEMDSIDAGTFFNKRQIALKVFLIIFLSFSLLSLTFIQESTAINNILNKGYGDGYSGDEFVDEEKPEEKEDERDIFGNKTEIETKGEPVPLEIKGYYSESGEGEELEHRGIENEGNKSYEMISSGERKEYKEDEILKDPVLSKAIKEKYNRTQQ